MLCSVTENDEKSDLSHRHNLTSFANEISTFMNVDNFHRLTTIPYL